jgi:hypothetical protein
MSYHIDSLCAAGITITAPIIRCVNCIERFEIELALMNDENNASKKDKAYILCKLSKLYGVLAEHVNASVRKVIDSNMRIINTSKN